MAMSLNRAQIIGNITRDPEIRQIPGGSSVATFSVATNFTWNDSSGQKQEKVEFHNVVAWRKLADICGQYLKKGMKVYIDGRIQTRDWEGEDGVKRYRTEIIVENMIMLDRKGADGGAAAYGAAAGAEMAGVGGAVYADEGASSGMESVGPAFQSEHGGLKNKPAAASASAPNRAPVSEDEVTIDDLPF